MLKGKTHVALVGSGVGAVTAVRISCVAVRLDLARRRAHEARGASVKLRAALASSCAWRGGGRVERERKRESKTYPSGLACPDVVGQTIHVCGSSHQDDSLDLRERGRVDENSGVGHSLVGIATTTEGDVKDLSTLYRRGVSGDSDRHLVRESLSTGREYAPENTRQERAVCWGTGRCRH